MVHNPEAASPDNLSRIPRSPGAASPDKPSRMAHIWRFLKKAVFIAVILAFLGILGVFVYIQPQTSALGQPQSDNAETLSRLENQISILQSQIRGLQAENDNKVSQQSLADMNNQIADLSKLNHEILDSKASNAAMIGLISRLDNLESKIAALGKVSSRGALILTAALLVKDSAANGQPFEYEAEVLKQLAAGTSMESPAETIAVYAAQGIKPAAQLIEEFNHLYTAPKLLPTPEQTTGKTSGGENEKPAGWKEKINSKLSELVIIEYHDEKTPQDLNTQPKDDIYRLVQAGNLAAAANQMAANPDYQNDAYKAWQQDVKAQSEFNRALKRIEALTLAVMKAENLQNGVQ